MNSFEKFLAESLKIEKVRGTLSIGLSLQMFHPKTHEAIKIKITDFYCSNVVFKKGATAYVVYDYTVNGKTVEREQKVDDFVKEFELG